MVTLWLSFAKEAQVSLLSDFVELFQNIGGVPPLASKFSTRDLFSKGFKLHVIWCSEEGCLRAFLSPMHFCLAGSKIVKTRPKLLHLKNRFKKLLNATGPARFKAELRP